MTEPHTPDPDEALVGRVRCALADTDPEGRGDNLAILFCDVFDRHPDCPEEEVDDEYGWKPWVIARTDAALDMLARAVIAELSKPLNGREGYRLTRFHYVQPRLFDFIDESTPTWEIPHDE